MDVKGSSWNQLRTFIFKSVGCKVKKHTQQDVNSYHIQMYKVGVDRYVFFRADADTDYYRSSRPITDILNRYTCLV